MTCTTDALIIREVAYGETDKMLTLLTPEYGRVGVMARGARSMRSRLMTATQLYSWGNFEIFTRGEYHWLREAVLIEPFFGLRGDLDRLSLAAYLCDVIYDATGEMTAAAEELRVLLNSLYAIAHGLAPTDLIKGAFEMRIAAMAGFCPDLSVCALCQKNERETGQMYLDVMNGCLCCAGCLDRAGRMQGAEAASYDVAPTRIFLPLPSGALDAMRYALAAPAKRLFSFRIDGEREQADFARACESFLLNHFERGFSSLEFYHTIHA